MFACSLAHLLTHALTGISCTHAQVFAAVVLQDPPTNRRSHSARQPVVRADEHRLGGTGPPLVSWVMFRYDVQSLMSWSCFVMVFDP